MCSLKSDRHFRKSNVAWCLLKRQHNQLSCVEQRTISHYVVYQTTLIRRASSCKFPGTPQSTYFLAFSPDGETIASCHNDHSVRVSDVKTGQCSHILEGHPRSPWCVVFHPSNSHLLASGCLGGVVNVWDLTLENKLITSLSFPSVVSLAFHPTDMVLLIATGHQLLFWSWYQPKPFATVKLASTDHKIRLVKFDPLGHHILTGICDSKPMMVSAYENTGRENPIPMKDSVDYMPSVVCVDLKSMKINVDHLNTSTEEEFPCDQSGRRCNTATQISDLYRLQWWDFTHLEIPELQNKDANVIAHACKLYNNASADISADGCLLTALVDELVSDEELHKVCVFSLDKDNLGQCLYSVSLGRNTFSTCFSPLGTHLIVGVSHEDRLALFSGNLDKTMAYIFKLCDQNKVLEEAVQPLSRVATLKLRKKWESREYLNHLAANAVLWHPCIEHGLIAFGTNKGEVYFCHV